MDELARRHQIPCPECTRQTERSHSSNPCPCCDGEGAVGNCPECQGRGILPERPPATMGCNTCQTKGWIGNCPSCEGIGIVDVRGGHKACSSCGGYGHLETDLRPSEPARFAVIVRNCSELRFRVACGPTRLGVGRWSRPHVNVDLRLHDNQVAKEHFEMNWDNQRGSHVIRNLGARYPPSVNGEPVGHEGRQLVAGDVISIGAWTLEYVSLIAG